MLFDLRSRGRRRTVQAVYLSLALLMVVGLIGVGVGTGSGNGGILNAFSGSGSGNQKQVVSSQEKQALREVKANPNSAAAWGDLLQARWTSAANTGFDSNTQAFTAAGKKELAGAVSAWQRYIALTSTPDANLAVLAARANVALGNYGAAASAWEQETVVAPNQPKGYECLAVNAYAASQSRKGDLAAAKAISLLPKIQRLSMQTTLKQAKSSASSAQQLAQQC